MSRAGNSLVTVLALALATPAVLADVLVVAPAGAPFTQINAAVAAAQPGDIVLVKSGTYDHVSIGNKSVSIIADAGATAVEVDGIGIANLKAPNFVVLRGLTVPNPTLPELPGFSTTACTGAVRVEQCSFTGMAGGPPNWVTGATGYATDGANLSSSSQVSFAHCSFVGGKGWAGTQEFNPWEGGYGLNTFQSSVSLWQCSLTGGAGGDGNADGQPTTGGTGAVLSGGTTVLDGCTLTGGTGGKGVSTWLGGPGGTGGDAALTIGGLLRHTDTAFVVGAGGPGGIGMFGGPPGAVGAPGGGLVVLSGSAEAYTDTARDLTVNSPVRSGQVATFQFGVVSCDAVLLVYSATTQGLWLGGPQGTLIPGLPLGTLGLALPCATGSQPLAATIPALPAGIGGVNVFVQALHVNATSGSQLGPFTVLTLLHPSIP